MKSILLDTDVLMDFFTDRQPFAEDAKVILDLCEKGKLKAFVTPVIISNLYYLLRRTGASHNRVVNHLKLFISNVLTDVVQIDKTCILESLDSDFTDFEDALQSYASFRSQLVSVIVTRNTKDFKRSSLSVMSPKELLAIL